MVIFHGLPYIYIYICGWSGELPLRHVFHQAMADLASLPKGERVRVLGGRNFDKSGVSAGPKSRLRSYVLEHLGSQKEELGGSSWLVLGPLNIFPFFLKHAVGICW